MNSTMMTINQSGIYIKHNTRHGKLSIRSHALLGFTTRRSTVY